MAVRKKRIEGLVKELLQANNVTEPPISVEQIARNQGLLIRFQPLESDLSGMLYADEQHPVIGVNSSQPKVRQRFTIAHELGHYLLHQNSTMRIDRAVQVKFRNTLSQQGIAVDEMEANQFAAELLMPANLIAEDLKQHEAVDILDERLINRLVRRYNVSAQALLIRLERLGYIE